MLSTTSANMGMQCFLMAPSLLPYTEHHASKRSDKWAATLS